MEERRRRFFNIVPITKDPLLAVRKKWVKTFWEREREREG